MSKMLTLYGLQHLEGKTIDIALFGADLGTAVVTNGKVSIILPDEFDTVDSQMEAARSQGTLTFDSGFISTIVSADWSTPDQPLTGLPTGGFLKGEDGRFYYLLRSSPTVKNWRIVRADTSASFMSLLSGDLDTILEDNIEGSSLYPNFIVSTPDWTGGIMWPESPYFMLQGDFQFDQGGTLADWLYFANLWFKINTSGEIEFVNGALVNADFALAYAPGQILSVPHTVGGMWVKGRNYRELSLVSPFCPGEIPILVAYSDTTAGDGTADPQLVIHNPPSPSFNFVRTEETYGTGFPHSRGTFELGIMHSPTLDDSTQLDDSFFVPRGEITFASNAFFLPVFDGTQYYARGVVNDGSVMLCRYVGLKELENANAGQIDNNSVIDGYAATYPDGFILGMRIKTVRNNDLQDSTWGSAEWRYNVDLLAESSNETAPEILNSVFPNFPFTESGFNFDDTVGSTGDDYSNPSVFPTDMDDVTKPWLIFFPFIYASENRPNYSRLKVYEWDPKTLKARLMGDEKGKLFKLNNESNPDINVGTTDTMKNISIHWDRETDIVYFAINYQGTNSLKNRVVVAKFGTFHYTAKADFDPVVAGAGLNFFARAQLLRPIVQTSDENLGTTRRIEQFAVRFRRTGTIEFGVRFDEMDKYYLNNPAANGIRPLFSGDYEDTLRSTYDYDNMLAWQQRRPGPSTILSVAGFFDEGIR